MLSEISNLRKLETQNEYESEKELHSFSVKLCLA